MTKHRPEYSPKPRFTSNDTPYLSLLHATLERALSDIFISRKGKKHITKLMQRDDALEWLLSDEYNTDSFSYLYICEHLNIDPKKIRNKVLERL